MNGHSFTPQSGCSTLNVALSVWGQQFTRLPIDCQLQSEREHRAHGNKPLRSIGGLPR